MRKRTLNDAERAKRADIVIRVASPEIAALKLGWSLKAVLARRAELGLAKHQSRQYSYPDVPPQRPTKTVSAKAKVKETKKKKNTAKAKGKSKSKSR